jgi:methyltransferase family protein
VIRSIQSSHSFPLASVKPLDELAEYRSYCLARTRDALAAGSTRRSVSPIDGSPLEPFATIEGFEYGRCRASGSLFLRDLAHPDAWRQLLDEVSRFRRKPESFHVDIGRQRIEYVFQPKLDWIEGALRLHGMPPPRLIEVVSPPSDFTGLLRGSRALAGVTTIGEIDLMTEDDHAAAGTADAAVLLDAIDRVPDPVALVRAVARRLTRNGLLFVTSQVSSGFDIATLGARDLYLYPPDRTNCFSLDGLKQVLERAGFTCLEVSTPGVLDVDVVIAHMRHDPSLPLSAFERQLLAAPDETRAAFQTFLQEQGMSSFARLVARKTAATT